MFDGRLKKLEAQLKAPTKYATLHQADFENVEALDAEADRLLAQANANGDELTIIKIIYDDDWRPRADKTIKLTWPEEDE